MKISLPKICVLLLAIIIVGIALPVQATRIPVLDKSAKQRPLQATGQNTASTITGNKLVDLGNYRDIRSVKKRVGKSSRASTRMADIEKRISSRSAFILNVETGETIFAKNPDTPRQPASTIKVLTGLIAMKSLADNEKIKISKRAAEMPRSKIYLNHGKEYTANDLINAVLLTSANDASLALAERIAGSEKDFAKIMTLRAQLWGATQTVCQTSTGLTAKGQQSTARDLATIFNHAMNDEEFARRIRTTKAKTSFGTTLRNKNRALWQVDGTKGGKTGFTSAARQTYVGKFTREEGSIIVAIMGSETMWPDVKNLVEHGFQRKSQLAKEKSAKSRIARAN
jgi:D-alanyl-D-alanine carboxypeptidase (penicillin-binding protein 5/6)